MSFSGKRLAKNLFYPEGKDADFLFHKAVSDFEKKKKKPSEPEMAGVYGPY